MGAVRGEGGLNLKNRRGGKRALTRIQRQKLLPIITLIYTSSSAATSYKRKDIYLRPSL